MSTFMIALTGVPAKINQFFDYLRENGTSHKILFRSRKVVLSELDYRERYIATLSSRDTEATARMLNAHGIFGLSVKYRRLEG